MHSLEEARGWIEARVDDVYGSRVGHVVDVYFDPDGHEVHWMLVSLVSMVLGLTTAERRQSQRETADAWTTV